MRKTKKCKHCKQEFEIVRPLQTHCSIDCAISHANELKQKNLRKQYREAKEHAKTRQDWIKEVQQIFNKFVRERDKEFPCISCGKPLTGTFHAGHWKPTSSSPELRFNEQNVHAQCVQCNVFFHGNVGNYREGLIKRIGLEAVEILEGQHEPKKWTIPELKELKELYKKKLREIQND